MALHVHSMSAEKTLVRLRLLKKRLECRSFGEESAPSLDFPFGSGRGHQAGTKQAGQGTTHERLWFVEQLSLVVQQFASV
jgi:hypothetical protein